MTKMIGPDCAVMCNLISTHIHTHTHTLMPPWEDQCEWHRMTRMTGPDCVVMCNLRNTHTHTHTHTQDVDGHGDGDEAGAGAGHTRPGYESRRVFLFRPDLRSFAPTYPSPVYCSKNSSSQQQSVRCAAASPTTCWEFFVWLYVLGREGRRIY